MKNSASIAVLIVSTWSCAAWAAETRQLTLFTIASHTDPSQVFTVATDDASLILRCREQLALPVSERTLHVNGRLGAGHGGFNIGWSWHLDPDAWDLAGVSIELCDGRPSHVEQDLPYWLETVESFCPWSSYVAAEGAPYPLVDPARVEVELVELVSGLQWPVAVTSSGDGSGRLFVVEQTGRIRIVADGELLQEPFLEITDRVWSVGNEQGLLGLAFHPDFSTTGVFFVNYTDLGGDTVVSSFRVSDEDDNIAARFSEQQVLSIAQPYQNHNGGHLAFGPDGYLWIGTGDGGSAGDPDGNARNRQSLLGKMLRIEVDTGPGYLVPVDNPFVRLAGTRDEIWAIGLRNPWRYSFDRATGDLYIGDVGQNAWEEIDVEGAADPGGRDYGWNLAEGSRCFTGGCNTDGTSLPAAEYNHGDGCSVTGGYVYRGSRHPALAGIYIFADYCSGRIWALAPGTRTGWGVAQVGRTSGSISSFGEDDDGELYATGLEGTLYRVTGKLAPRAARRSAGRLTR
jgi:glucose/arabinose dehydrogenase